MKLGYLQPFIEYLRPSFAIFTFSIFTFSRTIPSKQPIPSKRPIAKLLPLPVDIDVLVNGFVNVINNINDVNHFVNDFVSNFVNDINDVKIKILTDTAMQLMEKWDVERFVNTITITKFKYLQPLLGFKFKFLTAMKLMER